VDHLVVLNGADGMSELFAKALTLGGTGLGLARSMLDAMKPAGPTPNGVAPQGEVSPMLPDRPEP
jgi:flotillin